jgi:predicted HTH domain antitoxin
MYELDDLLEAKLYDSKEELLNDAIRHLFIYKPDLKLRLAIHKYKSGKLSLAKTALLAGLTWMEMKEVLIEKGIQPLLGPESVDDIELEVKSLTKLM